MEKPGRGQAFRVGMVPFSGCTPGAQGDAAAVKEYPYDHRHGFPKNPNLEMRVIRSAAICGGMLAVIMPLYRMHTWFPKRNRQELG